MKKTVIVPVLFASLLLCNCHCTKSNPTDGTDSEKQKPATDTAMADSSIWGKMGEGTSMNVMEFVTDKGDTLYLSRFCEETGNDAEVKGDIRNFSDRFAVTMTGSNEEEVHSILSCVNVSQLMGTWKDATGGTLTLYIDGTADKGPANYTAWQICNGRLILSCKVSTEYGETSRNDTMIIDQLYEDSLKLLTPQHEVLSFGR